MIEEIIENTQNEKDAKEIIQTWRQVKKVGKLALSGLLGATLLWSSIYTVQPEAEGVVQRFGAYVRTTEPGFHFKAPFGIESVTKVPVRTVQKEEFGFRTLKSGLDSQYLSVNDLDKVSANELNDFVKELDLKPERDTRALKEQVKTLLKSEYLMLTGDLNIADVEWIVQYQIKDPVAYLFNIKEPSNSIRDASQAVMRRIIGNGSIDEAITIGRIENESMAKAELQTLLDQYNSGIHVVTVKLQSSNPPERVRPAFNQVNEAMQQKEEKINNAMQQYNNEVPRAIGEAQRTIEQANGYAVERVNEAQGNVDKFLKVLEEYTKAPEITRQRLYLETMSELLPKIRDKVIVDDAGLNSGFYRMFNLDMQPQGGESK
ncbi:FtsH protease activity modulator HflK [Candidatus Woesearchaeota archaeon CG10_big_fil_rev_8_21_14_0_10_30_7]|nr:MAG: FtsH protease activity modulator HflK [Candidatus Woesearchaeota archaeon CG10_big_fil_rev_8_21_14_0_10_30_7]